MAKGAWINHSYSDNRRVSENGKVYYTSKPIARKRINHMFWKTHRERVNRSNYISSLIQRKVNQPRKKTFIMYKITPSLLNVLRYKAEKQLADLYKGRPDVESLNQLNKHFDNLIEMSKIAHREDRESQQDQQKRT